MQRYTRKSSQNYINRCNNSIRSRGSGFMRSFRLLQYGSTDHSFTLTHSIILSLLNGSLSHSLKAARVLSLILPLLYTSVYCSTNHSFTLAHSLTTAYSIILSIRFTQSLSIGLSQLIALYGSMYHSLKMGITVTFFKYD